MVFVLYSNQCLKSSAFHRQISEQLLCNLKLRGSILGMSLPFSYAGVEVRRGLCQQPVAEVILCATCEQSKYAKRFLFCQPAYIGDT